MKTNAEVRDRSRRNFPQFMIAAGSVLLLGFWATSGSAQTYRVLHAFDGTDGSSPSANLMRCGTTLYGMTVAGGNSDCGVIFRICTDGTGYTVLKHFNGSDGSQPYRGGLVLSGESLYGMAEEGGISNFGVIFTINTNGGGYHVLKEFTGMADGGWPCGGLVLSGTTLYGTTSYHGTVFKINTDGSGFTVLKSFAGGSDGDEPIGTLTLVASSLYGVTSAGGTGSGTIFRVNTDGSGFQSLRLLNGTDGQWPCAGLVAGGDMLYGTADWGGPYNGGTVFRITTGGSFMVLRPLTCGSDGAGLEAGLLLSGNRLYGTAYEGGDAPYHPPTYGHGTVFQLNSDGTGFRTLKIFTGDCDGAWPSATLVLSGNTLYGTAGAGCTGNGLIFALSLPTPAILVPPGSQTAEAGSIVTFSTQVEGSHPFTFKWFLNNTNLISIGTNSLLQLTNVQPSLAGAYTVSVTNDFGAVTSAPAMLSVIAPVERRPVPALTLDGAPGVSLHLEQRSVLDLAGNWLTLDTITLTNPPQWYFDLTAPLPPQGFYRAWQPSGGAPPVLDLHFIPALTLNGAIGSSMRVDYINQFGPIDAWGTLATVTLTNTAQLYFDVSTIGQPARLWRLVPMP